MDGGRVVTSPTPVLLPASPLLDDPNLRTVARLLQKLDKANVDYNRFDRYYSGDQPLTFLSPEVEAQVGDRLAPMVINWPETITDSVNRRVVNEGFLLGEGGEADDELWRIWTANEMHHEAPLGQVDALVHGKAFISVWGNDDDPATPLISFESAHQIQVEYEPGTGDRVVRAAVKRWADEDTGEIFTTLYLPDMIIRYRAANSRTNKFDIDQVLPNPLGAVPIVPMVNRGRLLNREGRSELASIAPIADGINKLATDMMVTSEFYQTPRRWATGIQVPTDGADRQRLQAEAAAYWEQATKSKTWLAGAGVQFGQFPEANLDGFGSAIRLLTSALAAIGGLPPDDLGLNQVNPASAEARRAAETVLVLRAREKQSSNERAYVRAMRMAVAFREGIELRALPTDFSRMSCDWRDPATEAISQEMDAAVKGITASIYDIEAAQARVGIGPAERAAMKARRESAAATGATADVEARMALAQRLQADNGLTLNASLAAVGFIQAAATNVAEGNTASGAPSA
jgi:hypothetical protein